MPIPDEHQALSRRRDELRQELGHGLYWPVTRAVHGKTRFRSIAPEAVRQTEEQIAECHRFQRRTREFVDVSPRWCDAHLEANKPAAPEKRGLETTLTAELIAEDERLIGAGTLDDFRAIETKARQAELQLMGRAVAERLNADHGNEQGPHQRCACGTGARFAGRRPKTFTTVLGALTLERAWYCCV